MKLVTRLLKRNHELYKKYKLYERLILCLIREEDNAHRRNIKAVEYVDSLYKDEKEGISIPDMYRFRKLREILTMYETANLFDEINRRNNENNK